MDVLLKQDPDLFERYAIRDAEIAALHAWAMAEFSVANGLGNVPPITLGSLSVRHLQNLWARDGVLQNAVLGQERITEQRFNPQTGHSRTAHRDVPIAAAHDHTTLATECYHGGRNEAFVFGFSDTDNWYDFDLSGAYSTALAAIRMPDWPNLRVDLNASSYTADVMGLARLRFKFPADTRFPCLPIRSDNGLIFPLEGESYAGSPEIQLALDMGAEIEIEHGVIVPWLNDTRPIELFSRSVRQQREAQQKGSVYERTWKEIGNSVYGKLAQGLQEKRVYDSRTDRSQILPPSQITQAFLAAYTTSIVRAVLGELLHRIPENHTILSVTTDGFLTNANRKEIDDTGPLARFFAELASSMSDASDFLELKHFIPLQICCFKTRGQLSVGIMDSDHKRVTAKAGQKPPEEVYREAIHRWSAVTDEVVPDELKDIAENDWLLKLFVERDHSTSIPVWSFISMRDMAHADADIQKTVTDRRANMEYDFKRELVDPVEMFVGRNFGSANQPHLSLQSKPHRTLEDFQTMRARFDQWRVKQSGVLKNMADWESWNAFRQTFELRSTGVLTGRGTTLAQAKRMFLKAYSNRLWHLPGGNYQELAEWLTDNGYPTSQTDIKNAKRSTIDVNGLQAIETPEVQEFLELLGQRYPQMRPTD